MLATSMAIVGDGSVGKSAIVNAFKSEGFLSKYKQTVGFEIWDIGGQSINSKNLEKYLSSAKVVLIVYDTTNRESFLNIEDWLSLVKKYVPVSMIYLVGNKIDLISLRQITPSLHDNFIAENGLKGGFYFSAKTGENILKGFYQAAGESVGLALTPQELAYYDKVVKAHVRGSSADEGRTEFADQIEAEDLARQLRASQRPACVCS